MLSFVMIAEISCPSTGSNTNELGKGSLRYLEKLPSPVYFLSSRIESAMVEKYSLKLFAISLGSVIVWLFWSVRHVGLSQDLALTLTIWFIPFHNSIQLNYVFYPHVVNMVQYKNDISIVTGFPLLGGKGGSYILTVNIIILYMWHIPFLETCYNKA